jgi:hypothetical protein
MSIVPNLLEVKLHSLCKLKSLEVKLKPMEFLIIMKEVMLREAAAKSRKEVAESREAFKGDHWKPSPIPDGIVDFLRQNSPSSKVNIKTDYPGCFNLK